jgi:tRNA-specific adenosine deaminase 1
MMATDADDIALVVLEEFRKLPAKRKPAVRDNGLREWVPLSGIVVKGILTVNLAGLCMSR